MWRLTALQKHDFLLGAMIVSLDLNYDRGSASGRAFWSAEQRADMLSSLSHALAIWEADEGTSMEAYKGAKVLRIMVDKLKAQQNENQDVDEEMHPEHSAAMTLGMLSSGGVAAPPAFAPSPARWGGVGEGFGGPMEGVAGGESMGQYWGVGGGASLTDLPDNLDWVSFESHSPGCFICFIRGGMLANWSVFRPLGTSMSRWAMLWTRTYRILRACMMRMRRRCRWIPRLGRGSATACLWARIPPVEGEGCSQVFFGVLTVHVA